MTGGGEMRAILPNMGSSHVSNDPGLHPDTLGSQPRMFRKHKVLPHPRKNDIQRPDSWSYGYGSEASLFQKGASPSQEAERVGRGPEPPPTPPAHPRTSSPSHPADPSSPKRAGIPSRSTDSIDSCPPSTPANQQSPPTPNLTPDQTPPGPAALRPQQRPSINDRIPSKYTSDSRTESFITARENPDSSDDDDEDGRAIVRPILPSTKTSQSTVRQLSRETNGKPPAVGLGLDPESSIEEDSAPKRAALFNRYEEELTREQARLNEAHVRDHNLARIVAIKKRRPAASTGGHHKEVIEDKTVKPTNATNAVRSVSLQESPLLYPSRRVTSDRPPTQTTPSHSESSSSTDFKRSSVMSTKSTASTVVEAILVETAPQRRKTLRHVRKQSALRDSGSDASPSSTAPTSVSTTVDETRGRPLSGSRTTDATRERHVSTATASSLSSRKARREVQKNGGIPVVVVPERRSSVRSDSREPSLRSTSSQRSQRSQNLGSAPISVTLKTKEYVPHVERSYRRGRALSESDSSRAGDERTIDFPPVIPARSSSLSAPTSRNASRTASLTAESLRAHNAFQAQQAHQALQGASRELDKLHSRPPPPAGGDESSDWRRMNHQSPSLQPTVLIQHPAADELHKLVERQSVQTRHEQDERDTYEEHGYGPGVDRYGDPFFAKRLSVQNTPFSVASVDTAGTSQAEGTWHVEVSEAMAVNIYPHQSTSVVLVDHAAKPSESSFLEQNKTAGKATGNGGIPVTPLQQFSVDDVDSPLRNPRAPPKPPAINFIPATPSGLTPTTEKQKQLGNYYEMTQEKPKRSISLLRRTLTRRSTAEYGPSPARPAGLLTRTFSLSKNIRRRLDDWGDHDRDRRPRLKRSLTVGDRPADETRLHPYWRPAYAEDESSEEEGDDNDWPEDPPEEDRTYRYPPIDNRPALPRRSLSARIKRTFAILPARDGHYPATEHNPLDRRTIRRTPSGNLRVMKFRRSMDSLPRIPLEDARLCTAAEQSAAAAAAAAERGSGPGRRYTRLLRSLSARARPNGPSPSSSSESPARGGGFLPALGDKINIPRRLSERRREKRSQELRGMISGPREVRDGVGDVIRRNSARAEARAWRQI
ncbi:hypothetical protein VTK56DRAFT_1377 [Thermocarpiscus australiensis]